MTYTQEELDNARQLFETDILLFSSLNPKIKHAVLDPIIEDMSNYNSANWKGWQENDTWIDDADMLLVYKKDGFRFIRLVVSNDWFNINSWFDMPIVSVRTPSLNENLFPLEHSVYHRRQFKQHKTYHAKIANRTAKTMRLALDSAIQYYKDLCE